MESGNDSIIEHDLRKGLKYNQTTRDIIQSVEPILVKTLCISDKRIQPT